MFELSRWWTSGDAGLCPGTLLMGLELIYVRCPARLLGETSALFLLILRLHLWPSHLRLQTIFHPYSLSPSLLYYFSLYVSLISHIFHLFFLFGVCLTTLEYNALHAGKD